MAEVTFIDIPPDPKEPVTLVVDVSNAVPFSNGECVNNTEEDGDLIGGYLSAPKLSVVILQFDAQLKDPDLQVLEVKENKHSIIFMPPNPGLYSMVIKCNDENVSGSPLQLNLSPPEAKQVSLTKPPTGKIKTGQSIEIWFNSLLAGRGLFTATCKGEELGDIPVTITSGITGTHKVSFLPPQEDDYSLSVCYSGKHVKGSPYKIDLIPVKPNLVQCSQPIFPKGGSGPVEMDICTEGSGNAQLTAACAGSAGNKIPVNIDKVSKDSYHLKIDPLEDDLLTLTIKYGGKQVKGSPFLITVAKSEHGGVSHAPVQVTFGDLHIPETVDPDDELWIDVDCSKTFQGPLTAEYMRKNEKGSFPISVEKIKPDGTYRVKFTPLFPDLYTLTISLGGDVLPGGVFEINLLSKPCAKRVRHLGTSIPHDIGEPVVLKFDASKAGPGKMRGRVNSVSQAGHIDSRVDLVDEENGIYHLIFVPDGAAVYNIDMYWCDESIPCSPIYITITYPKEVTLSVPVNLQANHSIIVSADTSIAGTGNLTACCSGKASGDIVVKINQDSYMPTKYMIYFLPNVADLYILRVYFDGIQIKQSPIEIDLDTKKMSPSLEPVHEEVVPVPQEVISILQEMILVPQEVVPDPQEVVSVPQEEVPVPQEEVPVPQEDVPVPQEEVPVPQEEVPVPQEDVPVPHRVIPVPQEEVPVSQEVVPQEVVPVPQEEVPVPQEVVPVPQAVVSVPQEVVPVPQEEVSVPQEVVAVHPITKPYVIQFLDQLDSMDGLLAYAVDDDTCVRHTMRIRKGNNDDIFLVFYPQNTGLHFIHIVKYSKEIRGSPFKVEIADSNPLACVISNVPEKSYLNEVVALRIDASKAGSGDLNILATVPTGGRTAFDHFENCSGIFTIRFTPKVTGKHRIDVKWADITVPDSPIIINVSEITEQVQQDRDAASKVTILEESNESLKVKLLPTNGIHFYVKTDQIGQGKLTLKTEGPANPVIRIYEQDIDLYRCKINPVVSGMYHITILWNDVLIPHNPFKLDFTADKTYIINDLDLGNKRFSLHQPYKFRVNCGLNKGTLEVMATPMDSALVEVNLLKNNIYVVKIIPQVQGNHELSLKFAGKHILQSPYYVQFESPKTPTLSRYSSVEFDSSNTRKLSEFELPKAGQLSDYITRSMEFGTPNTQRSSKNLNISDPGLGSSVMAILSASGPIKVIASGPGLQGGIIGQEGNFIIETDSAEEGKLEISIKGPKGTFKMRVRHHPDDDRTLLARYDPTHIGEYIINILWREKHIEGSPFVVDIKAQEQSSG